MLNRPRFGAALLALALVFLFGPAALADDAAAVTIKPLIDVLLGYLPDVIGLFVAALVAWIGRHVKNETARRALTDAVQRAGQGVYETLAAGGHSIADQPIKNAAIAQAAGLIFQQFQPAMARFGLKPDDIHEMIRRSLGGLLAVDPTISVAGPPAAPAPQASQMPQPTPGPVYAALPPAPGAVAAALGALLLVIGLSACTAQPTPASGPQPATLGGLAAKAETTVETLVAGGTLFCQEAGKFGNVVAVLSPAGKPYSVIGRTAGTVKAVCEAIGATPVVPPALPAAAPVVTVPGAEQ